MAPKGRSTRASKPATAISVPTHGTLRGFGGRVTKSVSSKADDKNVAAKKIVEEDDEAVVVVPPLTALEAAGGKETDVEGAHGVVEEEGATVIVKPTISGDQERGRKRRRDNAGDEDDKLMKTALVDADKAGRRGLKRAKLDIRNSFHPLPTPPCSSPGSPSRDNDRTSTDSAKTVVDPPSSPIRSSPFKRLALSDRDSGPVHISNKQPTTRTTTPHTTASLPLEIQTLQTLHTLLLRTLSLHFAHHRGDVTVPANLHEVTQGMTKMWKVRRVTVDDVRRVLGVYEWENDGDSNNDDTTTPERNRNEGYEGGRLVKRTVRCPFRLVSTLSVNLGGGGKGEVLRLEYVGHQTGTGKVVYKFDEQALSVAYDWNCRALVEERRRSSNARDGGTTTEADEFLDLRVPVLEIEVGRQTQRKMDVGRKLRQSVLGGVTRESTGPTMHLMPDNSRNASSITTTSTSTMVTTSGRHPDIAAPLPASTPMIVPPSIKSRTSALFDRVKSRSLLSASNSLLTSISSLDGTTKPMSIAEQALHAHALGRVGDVVDILRMKQQQKLYNRSGVYGDDGSGGASDGTANGAGSARVSFSLEQIIQEVQRSVGVPMAREEVVKCVDILAGMSDTKVDVNMGRGERLGWIRLVTMGKVQSVVLSGVGWSGRDVARMLSSRSA